MLNSRHHCPSRKDWCIIGIKQTYGAGAVAKLGKLAGESRAAQAGADRATRVALAARQQLAQKEQMEMQIAADKERRQFNVAIGLESEKRARIWELEKMTMRSQADFQREEAARTRKLTGYDNVDAQLDKEIAAGRMSEKEAEPYKLKNDLARQGMNVSINDLRKSDEDKQYGIPPYWMGGKDAPEGSSERQLYESKLREGISGERTGTIPWYLSPKYRNTEEGIQAQEEAGIFLDEEVQSEQGVKSLDAATAKQILAEVGGDKERARQIARQRGYKF